MTIPQLPDQPAARALVVGLGHPDRGDDAVGLRVARELADRDLPLTTVRASTTGLLGLIEEVTTAERLVVIDAMLTGAPPGTVMLLSGSQVRSGGATFSNHGFDVASELALLHILDRLPDATWVIGVELAGVTVGTSLSAPVAAAVPEATRRAAEVAVSAEEARHVPR